ncbi:MAG TPA: DMT family transporter [Pyrinomonadaceae bacterium]|nr:DMT family transporter [Pyrinomonadaceae bacterium]
MFWFYVLVAAAAGAVIPVQPGVNSQLARWVGSPVAAAFVSLSTGALALLVYCLALRPVLPGWAALWQTSWWLWVGGLLGAFVVAATAAYAPRLGAATFIAVAVAGQMFAAILLDHFGLVGFDSRPAGWPRVLGAALLVAGVILIRKF